MIDDIYIPNDYRVSHAANGFRWWREAFALFARQAGSFFLISMAYWLLSFFAVLVCSLVPNVIGVPLRIVLAVMSPVFAASFAMAAARADRDDQLDISTLFAGCASWRPLVHIGMIQFFLQLLALLIFVLGTGALLAGANVDVNALNQSLTAVTAQPERMADILQQSLGETLIVQCIWWACSVALVTAFVLFLLTLAPSLVVLGGTKAMDAVWLSVRAVLANWRAFTAYGLFSFALTLVCIVGMGMIEVLTGSDLLMMCIAVLVFMGGYPIVTTSQYCAYKDIFADRESAMPLD
ncbi:hypothetical protein KSF73_02930 [Burkholderiaceae bacterium DAT-1]|nr:hypothetical protein [Burkholderiaceae bacterium DAT-1]